MNAETQAWMDEMARREVVDASVGHNKTPSTGVLPDPTDLSDGRGGYDQNRFAKWIVNGDDYHFISINDSGEMMTYDGGVYKPGGDLKIREMVVRAMDGVKVTTNKANETVFLVQMRVGVERDEIDSDENVINLLNGLYNMKTGQMEAHSPKYLSARQMNIEYNKDAQCPKIDKAFREILKPEDVDFLYELFGYTLLSNKRFQTAVFFEGVGANGKSLVMDLMKHFVGGACSDVTPNEMGGDDKYAIADLFGKALNVVDDLGNSVIDGVGAFKSVITGNSVRAQKKYGQPFTFIPNTLCIFGCNTVPQTTDTSEGYYRRMRIISFLNKFEGEGDDKNLIDGLRDSEEISGLFNKAVSAIRDVIIRGEFTGNMSVEEKRRNYMLKANDILMFFEERCDVDPTSDATIPKDDLFNIYALWALSNNMIPQDLGAMTVTVKSMGCRLAQIGGRDEAKVNCSRGISLKDVGTRGVQDPPKQGIDSDNGMYKGGGMHCSEQIKNIANKGGGGCDTRQNDNSTPNDPPCTTHVRAAQPSKPIDFDQSTIDRIRKATSDAMAKSNNSDGCDIDQITSATRGLARTTVAKLLLTQCGASGFIETDGLYRLRT